MKNWLKRNLFSGIVLLLSLSACYKPAKFPLVPKITYDRMQFKKSGNLQDSLILYVDFKDGDGDLGLRSDETGYPYEPYDFIVDANNNFVTLSGTGYTPPFYINYQNGQLSLFSETDNRPAYNCTDYDILTYQDSQQNTKTDTFYVKKNINNKNIFVDFYRKVNGDYQYIDWKKAFSSTCNGIDFNSRFPVFDEANIGHPLEGTIRYAMVSAGFGIILKQDTFKIKVYIKDRALHNSNEVESPDLTLPQITAN